MAEEERERDDASEQSRPNRPSNRMLAAIIIAACVLLFILINRDRTSISFLFFSAETSLWVALALPALGGFVAGFLVGRRRYSRR